MTVRLIMIVSLCWPASESIGLSSDDFAAIPGGTGENDTVQTLESGQEVPASQTGVQDEAAKPFGKPPQDQRPPNTLSEKERDRGFVLLFDGKSLDGWHGYQTEEPHAGWTVGNGMISLVEGKKGDLVSDEQYSSFDLRLQYRISENGNSGVFYHVDESLPRSPQSGPEIQIVDNNGDKWKEGDARHKDGANYALHPPSEDVSKPAGKWNALRVVVDGNHVRHFLNGTKIVDFEMHTDEWKEMVAATKFSKWPAYGMTGKGHIVLQDHGNPVSFRSIRILDLTAEERSAPADAENR